tara:strand:- start:163 stop:759 length:597 start_codon:yes stop_codon:yes gene_type:complete
MKTLKQTVLIVFAFTITLPILAQDAFSAKTKGTYFASGSIYLDSRTDKINDNKTTSFTTAIGPKVGYFVMDNLVVGLELNIQTSKSKSEDEFFGETEVTSNASAVLAFGRYYLDNNLFGEAAVGFGSQKTEVDILGEQKSSTFGFRIGAGYAFFLGDHVAIEPTLNYRWEDINPDGSSSDYTETISSIFLGIGISAYF